MGRFAFLSRHQGSAVWRGGVKDERFGWKIVGTLGISDSCGGLLQRVLLLARKFAIPSSRALSAVQWLPHKNLASWFFFVVVVNTMKWKRVHSFY